MRTGLLTLVVLANLTVLPQLAKAQLVAELPDSPSVGASAPSAKMPAMYVSPTPTTKFKNYVFDAFGPYPFFEAGVAAGLDQASNAPPEWRQGLKGYGKRFASDFGTAAVSTTARYALAEAFKQDTLYYRCECNGVLSRLSHAVTSTFIARRGVDGHRVVSVSSLVAPYVGTMTAVYGWYPGRYNAKDAFRMGNYSFAGYIVGNIATEFIHRKPQSWLSQKPSKGSYGSGSNSTPEPSPSQ